MAWTVLAEPHRREMLELLLERPHAVGELVERLGLSQPATSKHLRVLREAGLVQVRAQAQRRVYALDPAPLAELDAWLAPYRRLWEERLGLSQPSTSKHLRVLREAGLVQVRSEAQRRVYEIDPRPLAELDAWLAPYRKLWDERLDALERHLDEMED